MRRLNLAKVAEFIENNIGPQFHEPKINRLQRLRLEEILKRKNPYLFKAKGITAAHDLIVSVLEATVSSGEETTFGNFIEQVAVFVCEQVHGGQKASTLGLDLDFTANRKRYLVSIKSGPNWGNSGQIAALKRTFITAKRTLGTSGGLRGVEAVCVEGCCYGKDDNPDKGTHWKLCGERFWALLSNDNHRLYKDLIGPLGHHAEVRNEELIALINTKLNLFTQEFVERFCNRNGVINWAKLIEYNSGQRSSGNVLLMHEAATPMVAESNEEP